MTFRVAPSIVLTISEPRLAQQARVQDELSGAFSGGQVVRFAAHPPGEEEIRLTTGEIFCHPTTHEAKHQDKELVVGELAIVEREHDDRSSAVYFAGDFDPELGRHFPPLISFYLFLKPADFTVLLTNIRAGVYPTRVTLDYEETEAWELGGSGPGVEFYQWDTHRAVKDGKRPVLRIKSAMFDYGLPDDAKHRRDDLQPAPRAPTRKPFVPAAIGMAGRLGQVTYWFCLLIGFALAFAAHQDAENRIGLLVIMVMVILFGAAIRYVLARRWFWF